MTRTRLVAVGLEEGEEDLVALVLVPVEVLPAVSDVGAKVAPVLEVLVVAGIKVVLVEGQGRFWRLDWRKC